MARAAVVRLAQVPGRFEGGAHRRRRWPAVREREDEIDVGPRDLSAGNSLHPARMHGHVFSLQSLQERAEAALSVRDGGLLQAVLP